jgi:mannosyltransferase
MDEAECSTEQPSPTNRVRTLLDRPVLVVGVATVLTAVSALWGISARSLWLDEAFTVMHSRLPTGEFFRIATEREANAVLHSTFMHAWIQVSQAEWWLRLPSAIAVTALVPVTYLLGRRLFHARVGVVAAVLVAANGYVAEYAQEGRGYALLMVMAAASTLLFVRYLQEPSSRTWWPWVLLTCLLGYAHFFGALVIGAQVLALLLRRGLPTPARRAWLGVAVIGLAHIPLAAFLALGGDKGQSEGLPDLTPVRFIGAFARLSGNLTLPNGPGESGWGETLLGAPLMVLVAIPCTVALVKLWRSRRSLDEHAWGILLLTAWVLVPIGSIAVLSLAKPLFGARYFVEVIPAIALLAAVGLSFIRPRWAQVALATGIVALGAAAVVVWHLQPPREDAAGVVDILSQPGADGAEPGDVIVFAPWYARVPVEVYLEDQPDLVEDLEPIYPLTPWGEWTPDDDPGALDDPEVIAATSSADRVWVVSRANDEGSAPELDTIDEALTGDGFTETVEEMLDGLVIRRYER